MPGQQLSLFDVGDQPISVADVEGLLLAGGALVRRTDAVRISVVVAAGWRSAELLRAMAERALGGDIALTGDHGRCSVRSGFDPRLLQVAARWVSGARTRVPPRWTLDGHRLRLWAIAAGNLDQAGYLLRLGGNDEQLWDSAGAALSAAGVPGVFLGTRAGGPAYRVVGTRRLRTLRELLGAAPQGCPEADWPGPGNGSPQTRV